MARLAVALGTTTCGLVAGPSVLPARAPVGAVAADAATILDASRFQQTWSVSPIRADQGAPIAESSPMVATLDGGGPSVVVGDRSGFLYAWHLSDGSPVAGWPVQVGAPIDSTPSIVPGGSGGGLDEVLVGAGNAAQPDTGGYLAFLADGRPAWAAQPADPPTDPFPAVGVQASLTVARLQGQPAAFAGSLGQMADARSAADGTMLTGWPFFEADTTFSTAAAGDFYGTGQTDLAVGGASTAGTGLGQTYPQGGHLRIFNPRGGLVCHYDTDQEIDSSPAVGPFLTGGATGIVVGTGSYWSGASDTDVLRAFDAHCRPVWTDRLDGATSSSPALADIEGNGRLYAAEGTDDGSGGSVWVIDAASGQVVWDEPVTGRVIGSVVTADLAGAGYQDLLVPTTLGTDVIDGRSGQLITVLSQGGYQNAPLVTRDPDGLIGITIAGYGGVNEGVVFHYEVTGSSGGLAAAPGAWPMFHHDPQLSGLTSSAPLRPDAACDVPAAARAGYDLVASDGGIFSYGPPFCGSTGGLPLVAPVVGGAAAPASGGYWLVARDGGVFAFGGAAYHGSAGGLRLAAPVVGMAPTPDGRGYWLVAADGGVFSYGDAYPHGALGTGRLASPVVGAASTADGGGYFLVAGDGGVFAFGDAAFHGSAGGVHLARPIVAMAEDPATGGYWLVASDGGVFAYGAPWFGSTGGVRLAAPIVGITPTEDGNGYWLVASDGGVFSFGDARFHGSTGGLRLARPVVGLLGMEG